jgi:hypothetical protein
VPSASAFTSASVALNAESDLSSLREARRTPDRSLYLRAHCGLTTFNADEELKSKRLADLQGFSSAEKIALPFFRPP